MGIESIVTMVSRGVSNIGGEGGFYFITPFRKKKRTWSGHGQAPPPGSGLSSCAPDGGQAEAASTAAASSWLLTVPRRGALQPKPVAAKSGCPEPSEIHGHLAGCSMQPYLNTSLGPAAWRNALRTGRGSRVWWRFGISICISPCFPLVKTSKSQNPSWEVRASKMLWLVRKKKGNTWTND